MKETYLANQKETDDFPEGWKELINADGPAGYLQAETNTFQLERPTRPMTRDGNILRTNST